MMKRRNFLTLVGGGTVLAATAGATGFALTRTPRKALAPWQVAGGSAYGEPRMKALSYAVLAPNPHNRQPWLVELRGEDQIVLTVDTAKLLPHTDPLDRQITIGLGCFLELLTMAAAEDGYRVDLDLFPDDQHAGRLTGAPIAVARFARDYTIQPDPLFAFVHERRSNKEPFDISKPVPDGALEAILAASRRKTVLAGTNEPSQVKAWRELTEQALQIEIDTPRTYKESVDLFRIGKSEINANPDGIDFSGPLFETLALLGQFDRDVALDRESTGFKQGEQAVLDNTRTAMAHVWMVTTGNARQDQIAAGGDWLRVNLEATRQGLAFHPLSQALQEYDEMKGIYAQVHSRLAPGGGTVQMLARLGYGPAVPVSPRWPLEAKLIEA
jgi:hypothetical protein